MVITTISTEQSQCLHKHCKSADMRTYIHAITKKISV